jgi:hypothetical protein
MVCWLFKAAIMKHFRVKTILHIPGHHLHKSSIEVTVHVTDDLSRVDGNGRCGILVCLAYCSDSAGNEENNKGAAAAGNASTREL